MIKPDQALFSCLSYLLFIALSSCQYSASRGRVPDFTASDTLAGEPLAVQHCSRCHLLPEPGQLDSLTWAKYVLPRMADVLGISSEDSSQRLIIGNPGLKKELMRYGYFPDKPLMDEEAWQKLKAYYLYNAPEKLATPEIPPADTMQGNFRETFPGIRLSPPGTTLIRIDSQQLMLGDAQQQMLYQFDDQLKLMAAARVKEGAVDLEATTDGLLVTVMGSFAPTDEGSGFVLRLPDKRQDTPDQIINRLRRPVDTQLADLNQDGLPDLLISEFGQWTGQLAWWENRAGGGFQPHILKKPAGAIRSLIRDINRDGLPDILALFGQGDEGIWAFINRGAGKFDEQEVLRFPPSYGSVNMRLFDYDGDGDEDLIYVAGDNADYTPILKPYHGIYIYLNDGSYGFTRNRFFHLPGAYDAIPADYDQDGDLDIAAIAFFPDYRREKPLGFLYLEQVAKGTFKRSTFRQQNRGRWIVMDAGDLDGDGDLDIALGSLAFETVPASPLLQQWVSEGVPFVVLENQSLSGRAGIPP
jgi:hypothetical protein